MAALEKSFGSNTCRCTGFRPILDTMKSFGTDATPQLMQQVKDIEDLCIRNCEDKNDARKNCPNNMNNNNVERKLDDDFDASFVKIENVINIDYGETKFFKVYEENEIFDVWSKYGCDSYMLVDGNTGKGNQSITFDQCANNIHERHSEDDGSNLIASFQEFTKHISILDY